MDIINALDKAPSRKAEIQYSFNLLPFQADKLLHKPNFRGMGKLDMFSVVSTPPVRLSGVWMRSGHSRHNKSVR